MTATNDDTGVVVPSNSLVIRLDGGSGSYFTHGTSTELITLSTSTTVTTSTTNLFPANSYIDSVSVRMVTTITTATTVSAGDPTSATRFISAAAISTSTPTVVGVRHIDPATATTQALSCVQVSATTAKLTMNVVPGAGTIRVTVYYRTTTAATS